MKRLCSVFFLVSLLFSGTRSAQAQEKSKEEKEVVFERIVAVVNNTIILEGELRQRAQPLLSQIHSNSDTDEERSRRETALYAQLLRDVIDEELIVQAAQDAKLEVYEKDIDKAIEEVKKQSRLSDEDLEKALTQERYSMLRYRQDLKRQLLRMRAISVLVRPRVNITETQVREQYEKLQRKAGTVSVVHLRHILLTLPANAPSEETQKVRHLSNELVARIRAGEDFVELAKKHSQDSATRDQGGDVGWVRKGDLPPEWEEVLFGLEVGAVRGPFAGPEGLHVFQVADVKRDETRPFAEAKEQLHEQLFKEEMEKQTALWLEELRGKAHIEIKVKGNGNP